MEVISLRLQYMDVWLRVYYQNTPHTEPREREFGRLLTTTTTQVTGKVLTSDDQQRLNAEALTKVEA